MDWVASLLTVANVWFLGEQKKCGWFFGMAGNMIWVVYALWITWQLPLALLNIVFFGLNIRGYRNWSEEDNED